MSSKTLGLLLFMSIAAISISKANNMWSKRPGFLKKLTSKSSKKVDSFSSLEKEISYDFGLLIIKRSEEFTNNDWRKAIAEQDKDDKSQFGENKSKHDISCEIEFINDLNRPVTLCWVSSSGQLFHYYPINDKSIDDGSVHNSHVEFTEKNHSFVCFTSSKEELPKFAHEIRNEDFLVFYKPKRENSRHILNMHYTSGGTFQCKVKCIHLEADCVIDSSNKEYISECICGFMINYEPDVFENNSNLMNVLTEDLEALSSLLPVSILDLIKHDTPIWLDHQITFGTKAMPIEGVSCTYHSCRGEEWLHRVGMNTNKSGSVEIYCAKYYLESRLHWGVGGVLLHEFAHSVHDKYCLNGFDNEIIREAYRVAMDKCLYDAVEVHGPQGLRADGLRKLAKAYACTNCMEYFAELSVAYFWVKDDIMELNKWFPFNREQILKHDPDTLEVLHSVWEGVEKQAINRFR